MPSLLLNADYEPVGVIGDRAAILLVVMEDAESLVDTERAYHSAGGLVVPVPSVMRLIEHVKIRRRARLPISRRNVLTRDGYVCGYCQGPALYSGPTTQKGTVDHIVPRARGGKHTWLNVVTACQPCNARKGDKTLNELGWTLVIHPTEPEGQLRIRVKQLAAEQPEWAPYLGQLAS